MQLKTLLLISSLCVGSYATANAQGFVPSNMNFETGTTANWTYYAGTVATGHIFSVSPTPATTGLHEITTGSGTDYYGGFPVVGSGMYSLKLAHDTGDNNADAASYTIHVPTGGAYTLEYRYAAVLQDTAHMPSMLPIMKVTATDSATGLTLSDSLSVMGTSSGFMLSTMGSGVFYKPWTAATIDMAGYGGHTVIVRFIVSACASAGHFGYGYIDVDTISYISTVGVPAVASTQTISAYPNPTTGMLNITWADQSTGAADMYVTDMAGRVISKTVLNMATTSGATQMNLGGLNNGMYMVTIKSASVNYCTKVVVQH